jgi:hypothetical protein
MPLLANDPKVLVLVEAGRTYRLIGSELGLNSNTDCKNAICCASLREARWCVLAVGRCRACPCVWERISIPFAGAGGWVDMGVVLTECGSAGRDGLTDQHPIAPPSPYTRNQTHGAVQTERLIGCQPWVFKSSGPNASNASLPLRGRGS